MNKREDGWTRRIAYVTAAMLLSVGIVAFFGASGTAYTTDVENFTSNVSVNKQIAIGISAQMTDGVAFGDLNPNTEDNADPDNANNIVTMGTANNIGVDLCIRANANLSKTDTVTIGMLNYTWWDNTTAGLTENNTPLNTSYLKANQLNAAAAATTYWGFWVDIPPAQAAGVYNNSIQIKAVETAVACGT